MILSVEILCLIGAVALGITQLMVAAHLATKQRGVDWNFSSRDEPQPPLKGLAGRADRAFANFKETFPFFLAGVFVVMITQRGGMVSAIGACLYLAARLIYVPLYLGNVTVVRTGVLLLSLMGILAVFAQVFIV